MWRYTCSQTLACTHTGTPHTQTNVGFLCLSGCISIGWGSSLNLRILLYLLSNSTCPSLATLPSFEEKMPTPHVSPFPTAINTTHRVLRHLANEASCSFPTLYHQPAEYLFPHNLSLWLRHWDKADIISNYTDSGQMSCVWEIFAKVCICVITKIAAQVTLSLRFRDPGQERLGLWASLPWVSLPSEC